MSKHLSEFFPKPSHFLTTIILILAISFSAINPAQAVSVEVVDQNGEPVEFAVISAKNVDKIIQPLPLAVMDQINKQFEPRLLVLRSGQQVAFPNSDDIRHHIYSFSKPKPFEIRMFKGGESKKLLFDKPGIVVLGCNIHDQMVGYIYVSDNELTAITDNTGRAMLDTSESQVHVWHSRLSLNHGDRQVVEIKNGNAEVQKIILHLLPEKKTEGSSGFRSSKFSKK